MLNESIVAFNDSDSLLAEKYRLLCDRLENLMESPRLNTFLITSSIDNEEQSVVCSNVGVQFALQDKKVIIIDANIDVGTQHELFGLSNNDGLFSFLDDINSSFEKIIKKTEVPNLYVITSGPLLDNSSELVCSQTMEDLVRVLKESFDFVILNGASVLKSPSSINLSTICDEVILVESLKKMRKNDLKTAKRLLVYAGANIAGVVLNK